MQFEDKKETKKYNVGTKFCAKADENLKERTDTGWNKGGGDLRARLHPDKLLTCEKETKENMSSNGMLIQI